MKDSKIQAYSLLHSQSCCPMLDIRGKISGDPLAKIYTFVEGNPAGKGLVKFEDNTFWKFSNELDEQGKKN